MKIAVLGAGAWGTALAINLLKNSNASVLRFIRYEVGEGIEKKEENFADEVMKQIKGES